MRFTIRGEVRKITNDPNFYLTLSMTADANTLLTLKSERATTIWLSPVNDQRQATALTGTRDQGIAGIAWSPSESIVYSSVYDGNLSIWRMNRDGPKQLTLEKTTTIVQSQNCNLEALGLPSAPIMTFHGFQELVRMMDINQRAPNMANAAV